MESAVVRQTLADQVVARAVEAIVVGDIAPGSPVSENEVALRFGVSRGPAREALLRLEAKGLVTRVAHFGARVTELTCEDLQALYELREALEGMACRLAATRIAADELAGLEATLAQHAAQLQAAAGQSYYQPGGDRDFHFRIATASNSPRLSRALLDDLYDVMRVYRFRSSLRPGRAHEAFREHHHIVAALKARDEAGAEAAMRAHIRASWENTRQTFRESR